MNKKLYIGNLSYDATEDEIRELFTSAGPVASVSLMIDRETGRPKGFGFVEMETAEGAQQAVQTLNGKMLHGREIKVDEARPPRERGSRDSFGGRRGGGGGDRGDRGSGFGAGGREKGHGTPRRTRY
jgi:RNA recognition motif-containing protein